MQGKNETTKTATSESSNKQVTQVDPKNRFAKQQQMWSQPQQQKEPEENPRDEYFKSLLAAGVDSTDAMLEAYSPSQR